ncbi:hypothetical protein A2690_03220 [Candidatus Roizmanbacteria bacterium RIFCSPHIGHO2_01_FULL_39_12b]|uniref:SpoVT-AbrB domain-containing protein n=1 Tax=Candidatus Roizmanbacteria bacterium RIFCSPHIGHO2_01_FULL_39_12b TaxID=1802030 RepID=A0A1F7GBC2_9BACT|nr:MAG: hypothetical protein A2690_03220 [Candidatus Roizmanbacteria bacterium RIFCSPHIGHO2_01_FULL_39_12b]
MKIGIITSPNEKGQIVIPKAYRDKLSITSEIKLNILLEDNFLSIYPIYTIASKPTIYENDAFLAVLKKTQGAWRKSNKTDKAEIKRNTYEFKETQKNKKLW